VAIHSLLNPKELDCRASLAMTQKCEADCATLLPNFQASGPSTS
jgi:hypothetical protein